LFRTQSADVAAADAERRRWTQAEQMRQLLIHRNQVEKQLEAARDSKRPVEALRLEGELQQLLEPLGQRFHASDIQVLINHSADFKQNLERLREELAKRGTAEKSLVQFDYPRPVIVQNSADEKSVMAHSRVPR